MVPACFLHMFNPVHFHQSVPQTLRVCDRQHTIRSTKQVKETEKHPESTKRQWYPRRLCTFWMMWTQRVENDGLKNNAAEVGVTHKKALVCLHSAQRNCTVSVDEPPHTPTNNSSASTRYRLWSSDALS